MREAQSTCCGCGALVPQATAAANGGRCDLCAGIAEPPDLEQGPETVGSVKRLVVGACCGMAVAGAIYLPFPQTRLWLAIYGLIAGFVIAAIIYLLLPLIRALFHMIAHLFIDSSL